MDRLMLTNETTKSLKQIVLISLLLGGAFVRASAQTSAAPSGEVTLTVSEQFLNSFLEGIFTNLKAPSVPLVITPSDKDRSPADSHGCVSAVTLQKEEAGVKTAVKL